MKLKTYRVSIALLLSLCGSQVSARVITGTIRHAVTTLHTKLEAENRTSELSADFLHVYDCIQKKHLTNCDQDVLMRVIRELQSHGLLQIVKTPDMQQLLSQLNS